MIHNIDEALEREGFKFNRRILETPEHRLMMALHQLDTDIVNNQIIGKDTSELEAKYNRLKQLESIEEY